MVKGTRKWIILTSIGVGLLLVGAVLAMDAWLGVSLVKASSIMQALVTVVAIGVGGVWAFYKLGIFREFQPHLTITQETSHRRIGDTYIHISIQATLRNTSRVAVEIRQASFRMQQLAPFSDEEVEILYSDFQEKPENEKAVPFPNYSEFSRRWGPGDLVIEPGETETERYEFIVGDEFNSVILSSFFVDSTKRTGPGFERGWEAVSVYDVN
ncbi:MAG: hypothetical protein OXC83_06245 [Chloroflexi bacterium]|nr:hypothetical protein [Chloroflexota bacterium]